MTAVHRPAPPRHRLRSRLLVALVGLAVGVLFVTAGATALVSRANARTTAVQDLEAKVDELQTTIAELLDHATERRDAASSTTSTTAPAGETRAERRARRRAEAQATTTVPPAEAEQRRNDVRTLLGLFETLPAYNSGVVVISESGEPEAIGQRFPAVQQRLADQGYPGTFGLPPAAVVDELDTTTLRAGARQTGAVDGTAFVAQPVRTEIYGEVVLVVTQAYETRLFGNNGGVFLLIAGLAILAAVGIAYVLARRLTRPIAGMQAAADRIAAGDLSARVEVPGRDDELAALARTLNGMTEQLGHAKNLERSFLLSVSHDLRTPLTSIAGYAEAIEDGTLATSDDRVRAARVIRAESRRLERLVADLLDLARLDAHEFTTTPRPIDAAAVVRESVDAFGPQAVELGLVLDFTGPGELAMDVDPERLAQIVANLVENALKYAATNVRVLLAVEPVGGADRVAIAVDDDGPGIDPSDVSRVFERLYTSRTSPGRTVGTGLGLAIVRDLSTAMGGTVRVEPAPVAVTGTRFVVTLPRA